MEAADDRRVRVAPPVYLGLFALAELAIAYGPPGVGLASLACLFLALQIHATFSDDLGLCRLLFALSLVPVVRMVAMGLAALALPQVAVNAAMAAAITLAALRAIHELQLSPRSLGLGRGSPLGQAGVALLAVPLGLAEYALVQPAPATTGALPAMAAALVALLAVAFAEEMLFRGVLLQAARRSIGPGGPVFGAAVFAVLHVSYGSPLTLLLAFGVGLLFSRIVERTGSILGVTLANGLGAALAYLALPHLWRLEAQALDLRGVVEALAQVALAALVALLAGRWLYAVWRTRRSAAEARALRAWAAEVSRLAAGAGQADLEAAARALCARLGPQQVLVVELDAVRARTVVRVSLGATGRRLHGPEGLEAPWAAFARLVDMEALGPQQVGRHPFGLSEGPHLVMPLGSLGRWAVVRPRPGREEETRRHLAALVRG